MIEKARCSAVLFVVTLAALCGGCRPRRTASEVKELRDGIYEMARQQEAAEVQRQQLWANLEKRFDHDRDGKLNEREESSLNAYLKKIRNGQAPNPFVVP